MEQKKPIAPYMAVGISSVAYGISKRADIKRNLDNLENLIRGAITTVDINMPVKIVALAEGWLEDETPHDTADRFHILQLRTLQAAAKNSRAK